MKAVKELSTGWIILMGINIYIYGLGMLRYALLGNISYDWKLAGIISLILFGGSIVSHAIGRVLISRRD